MQWRRCAFGLTLVFALVTVPGRLYAQAPAAPTGLTVSPLNAAASLSWTASTGAAAYNVKRSLGTGGPYLTVANVTTITCTDTGLNNGTAFYYVVSAVNAQGESANSTEVNVTPQPPPAVPGGLTAAASQDAQHHAQVTLNFNASPSATSYNIRRASTFNGPFTTLGTGSPGYVDSSVTDDASYFYVVTAVNGSGESPSSNEAPVTTLAPYLASSNCGTPPPPNYQYVSYADAQMMPVTQLALKDVYLPSTLKLTWLYGGYGFTYHFAWQRTPTTASGTTDTDSLADSFNFTPGQTYIYTVQVIPDCSTVWTTYVQAGVTWYLGTTYTASPTVSIAVTPGEAVVSDDQPVDSRLDPRYSTNQYINFPFGTDTFNGGLYAGNSTDPSSAGRSFLRIPIPDPGATLWAATVNAYLTSALNSNGTGWSLGCQSVTDNGWTSAGLTWSGAPALTPANITNICMATYDTANPASYWLHWEMLSDVTSAMTSGMPLSLGLAMTTESSDQQSQINSWLYLARKELSGGLAPCVLYAAHGAATVASVTVGGGIIKGGDNASGIVTLTDPAPAGRVDGDAFGRRRHPDAAAQRDCGRRPDGRELFCNHQSGAVEHPVQRVGGGSR